MSSITLEGAEKAGCLFQNVKFLAVAGEKLKVSHDDKHLLSMLFGDLFCG